jgi:competence ComEA-like helix-hairpin-helix protein
VKVEEPKVEEPEQKTEESEVVVEAEEPVEVVLEVPKKVNINTATSTEIMEHLGIGRFYPGKIVTHRNKNGNFVDLEELKMVEGLSKGFYDQYKDMLTIGEDEQKPEEPERNHEPFGGKVNVNTATAQEIIDRVQISPETANNIVRYRKKNGPFRDIADLVKVSRFGVRCLKKYGDMLTVGEIDSEDDGEPDEEPKSDKLNINTASLRDLMDVGFEKRAAVLIVNERKKFGRFRSVDDLAGIPEITGKILRKLRDKLEV